MAGVPTRGSRRSGGCRGCLPVPAVAPDGAGLCVLPEHRHGLPAGHHHLPGLLAARPVRGDLGGHPGPAPLLAPAQPDRGRGLPGLLLARLPVRVPWADQGGRRGRPARRRRRQ
ncbi:unnamed protein product, partial [Ixodes pacificus]